MLHGLFLPRCFLLATNLAFWPYFPVFPYLKLSLSIFVHIYYTVNILVQCLYCRFVVLWRRFTNADILSCHWRRLLIRITAAPSPAYSQSWSSTFLVGFANAFHWPREGREMWAREQLACHIVILTLPFCLHSPVGHWSCCLSASPTWLWVGKCQWQQVGK